jgi:polysaccharide export outer membrane protein
MKTSYLQPRSSLVAALLLLVSLVLTGCYNPEAAPVGGYPSAMTGASQLPPYNTNMGPPVMAPTTLPSAPAPANPASAVLLRVGDMITVEFFDMQNPIQPYKERIRDDGKMILPLNVVVQAAGRTTAQLQDDIRAAYVPKYFNHLTPSVKTDERVYYVDGEVRVPNRQLYQDGMTVLRAIATAGGFTDFANRKRIELRRPNGDIIKVNWNDAMKDPKKDPLVYPNDQIVVRKRII